MQNIGFYAGYKKVGKCTMLREIPRKLRKKVYHNRYINCKTIHYARGCERMGETFVKVKMWNFADRLKKRMPNRNRAEV